MGAVRLVRLCVVVALLLLAGAGVAVADAPFRLADRVTDRAGVLDPAAKTRVQQAVDGLRAEKGYDLFVVYVRSFDGAQTAGVGRPHGRSSPSSGAPTCCSPWPTQDRAYYVSYAQDFPLSQQTTDAIADKDVEPRLGGERLGGRRGRAGRRVALRRARVVRRGWGRGRRPGRRRRGGGRDRWLPAGAAAASGQRRRRPRRPAPEAGEFADVNTDDLAYRGSQALLDVDDAVRRSEVELSAARAHFGDAAVAEFAAALEAARGEMLRGFTLRQQLDDDIPEDEPTKRRMLAEIITVCRSADERLDAQVAAFDQLRNLEATAPDYLAGLATRLDATNARLPVAEAAGGRRCRSSTRRGPGSPPRATSTRPAASSPAPRRSWPRPAQPSPPRPPRRADPTQPGSAAAGTAGPRPGRRRGQRRIGHSGPGPPPRPPQAAAAEPGPAGGPTAPTGAAGPGSAAPSTTSAADWSTAQGSATSGGRWAACG